MGIDIDIHTTRGAEDSYIRAIDDAYRAFDTAVAVHGSSSAAARHADTDVRRAQTALDLFYQRHVA